MNDSNSSGIARYEFSGIKHIRNDGEGETAIWDEFAIFQIIKELEKHGRWAEVRDLCEEQIGKTPEWLTPYLCAGVAHANLATAIERSDGWSTWKEWLPQTMSIPRQPES